MMEKYKQYSKGQLIRKIDFLESENNFLKEYIKEMKEFKDSKMAFNKWIENEFGGENGK